MKEILAIIPARAGSKGVPNKNIRIINGYPLIYYAIDNAKRSKHITEIIVSTDSVEIQTIAKQMGVKCHWRDAKLCEDHVTLDSVIYDAIPKDKKYDYIVTMQPTSPTLKSSTLDMAIEHAINKDLDTVISGINSPHLSWRDETGEKKPNYIERLNRQYLPACYLETGAFVISKREIVTEKTRIGKKVDIYEISQNESIDIDSFIDLRNAAFLLKQEKVAIYVNGNNKRGVGHIYRALELADEFFVKPDIYFDINQTDINIFGKTTHNLIGIDGIAELFECCRKEKYTIFINDILSTTIDYMIGLRSVLPTAKIINFEDDGEGILKADLVFNALYDEESLPQMKSGQKYYISSKMFMFYDPIEIKDKVQRVLITFGGADPQNYSDRLLKIVSKEKYKQHDFVVVLGRAKQNIDELLKFNKTSNIEVVHDISNMAEIMSSCDIAITSRGRTGYELALLGIPSIAMAQNQREEKHGFVNNENGFNYLGLNPSDEIIEANLDLFLNYSKETRQKLQEQMLIHDLRNGRKRVMNLIMEL